VGETIRRLVSEANVVGFTASLNDIGSGGDCDLEGPDVRVAKCAVRRCAKMSELGVY